jgi:hypothetical protein
LLIRKCNLNRLLLFAFSIIPLLATPSLSALELSRESIYLTLGERDRIHVSVTFWMEGELKKSLAIAFPETDSFPLLNFQVQWNGERLKVKKKTASKGKSFKIKKLSLPAIFQFKARKQKALKHKVIIDYDFQAPRISESKSPGGLYAEYIIQTGAPWDHDINEVLFTLRGKQAICNKVIILSDSFLGSCNEKGEYVVKLENIEPEKDLRYLIED